MSVEFWIQMLTDYKVFILFASSILVVFFLVPLIKKFRNNNLLKSVTSLKRGTPSERDLVLKLLRHGIPPETIFHDLCIKKNDKEYSQIDLVIATTEGIIVIEVKDYNGWLFGNSNQSHWTKILAYGKKKYRFYNPIRQNNNHINALRNQLEQFKEIPFYSIIVFYGNCEFKEINYVPKGTFLVKSHRVKEVLKLIKMNNQAAPYTNEREIINVLKQAVKQGGDHYIQKQHIENINEILGKERIFE